MRCRGSWFDAEPDQQTHDRPRRAWSVFLPRTSGSLSDDRHSLQATFRAMKQALRVDATAAPGDGNRSQDPGFADARVSQRGLGDAADRFGRGSVHQADMEVPARPPMRQFADEKTAVHGFEKHIRE